MINDNFQELDFYGKIDYVLSVVYSAINGFESIVNEYEARDFILEIANNVEENFIMFSKDVDLNDDKRFKGNFAYYKIEVRDILDICPRLRTGDADYHYLLIMLKSVDNIIGKLLPDNVRLVRFFESLLDNKDDIADMIDVPVEQFSHLIEGMIEKSNSINHILIDKKYKKR